MQFLALNGDFLLPWARPANATADTRLSHQQRLPALVLGLGPREATFDTTRRDRYRYQFEELLSES